MRHAKCASAAHGSTGSPRTAARLPVRPDLVEGRTPFDRRTLGFSLLEVLVAFVILALVGTTLFRLFGASLNNAGLGDEYSRAASYAESRLAIAALDLPLRETTDQGASDDGHFAWAMKVDPYVPPGTTGDQDRLSQLLPMRLWRLSVTVSWPGEAGNPR